MIKSPKGPVIVTGCAHPGVVNIVKTAREAVPCDKVQMVIGGFHLLETPAATVSSMIGTLDKLSVEKIAPVTAQGARRVEYSETITVNHALRVEQGEGYC